MGHHPQGHQIVRAAFLRIIHKSKYNNQDTLRVANVYPSLILCQTQPDSWPQQVRQKTLELSSAGGPAPWFPDPESLAGDLPFLRLVSSPKGQGNSSSLDVVLRSLRYVKQLRISQYSHDYMLYPI